MDIGSRIKELRKKQGLNQSELAKIVNLTASAMSLIEAGRNNPTPDTIVKLSEFFNVSTDYLLKGIETEQTISESEQEILSVLREDKAMTNAVMEFAKVKKKAISFTRSYAAASQSAVMS